MKQSFISILLIVLMSMVRTKAFAYDIAVENNEGVTIYYNYINDGEELEVTYRTKYVGSYSGSVVIPEKVTYMNRTRIVTNIGELAFYCCHSLTSITIPNSVINIDTGAFLSCDGLTSVSIPNSVKSIGKSAFIECNSLTSITIPNSVTNIVENAFCNCSSLEYIIVESGNIKYDSRNNCNCIIETGSNKLIAGCQNAIIPSSVVSIGEGAFWGCSGLTSIEIPNSVTNIGDGAFMNCTSLTAITIPNSVTSIKNMVFCGCSGMTSVTIPNSVTSIGENAFQECLGLTSIEIPNSVTSIGMGAFILCTGLSSITIPSNVSSIGEYAFAYWDIPEVISNIENPFNLNPNIFTNNTFLNATLYVPTGTIEKYKTAEGWKLFRYMVELDPSRINKILLNSIEPVPVYDLNGRRLSQSQKGINIIRQNDGTIKKVLVK